MPIVLEYQPSYDMMGQAAFAGAGGLAAENVRRWQSEFGEGQRRFDLDYDYRLNMAALEDSQRRRALDQNAYLQEQQLAANVYGDQLRAGLAQQEMAQRENVATATNSRMLAAKQMEVAQRMQALNFEQAMAAEKAAREVFPRLTPSQQQQVIAQHEQRYGVPWGGAEQMLAEQGEAQAQADRQRWVNALEAPDGSGPMAPEAFADVLMQLDPKDAASVYAKLLAESRQRQLVEQKGAELAYKESEDARDNARAEDDMRRKQEEANQKAEQRELEFNQKMEHMARQQEMQAKMQLQSEKMRAQREYAKALQDYNVQSSDPIRKATGSAIPKPSWDDFWAPEMEQQLQSVMQNGAAAADLLPGEKIVTNPAGQRAILAADGKTIRKILD